MVAMVRAKIILWLSLCCLAEPRGGLVEGQVFLFSGGFAFEPVESGLLHVGFADGDA